MEVKADIGRETFYLAMKLYESHKACDMALSNNKVSNEFEFDQESLKNGDRYIKLNFIDISNTAIITAYNALSYLELVKPCEKHGFYKYIDCYYDYPMNKYINKEYQDAYIKATNKKG